MSFIVSTNVVASRTPERQLTGTLHARANYTMSGLLSRAKKHFLFLILNLNLIQGWSLLKLFLAL